MRVLIACEYSGRVRDAFRAKGHDAWSCDLLDPEIGPSGLGHLYHLKGDVRRVLDGNIPRDMVADSAWRPTPLARKWDMMIAHPTCTRLTNSGVRWLTVPPPGRTLAELWQELDAACAFYRLLRDAPIPLRAIENPIMHKYARERIGSATRRQIVQPWWFGDKAFKATGFELIGLPPLVATDKLTPPVKGTPEHKAWSHIHRASPGPNRWKERSRTFPGIAAAMADQWGSLRSPSHTSHEDTTRWAHNLLAASTANTAT